MKRYKKFKGLSTKTAAMFLIAAMIVQATVPAMASPLDQGALSGFSRNTGGNKEKNHTERGKRQKNATPSDAGNTDTDVDPDTIEKPDKVENPSETEKPDQIENPSETEKPDQGEKPNETEKPDESEKPNETERPNQGENPSETEKPDQIEKPNETEKPDQGENPNETENPGQTVNPNEIKKPEQIQKPEKPEKATLSSASKKESDNILPNNSFEETSVTNAGWKWVWVNETIPTGWGTWAAAEGNKKMSFEVVSDAEEAQDGNNYIRIHSEDKASRIDINYPIHNIDPTVNYLCTFWVRTENVEGTGFFVRLARLRKDNGKSETNVESVKIKGTTDGWVQYGIMTKDLPSSNTEGIQIDVFAEYISGDVWLDDIQIVPAYSLSLNKTEANMLTGDTLELKVSSGNELEEEVQWFSRDPEIADVDENGVVTAYKMGIVEIVARTDEFHEAVCKISIEDGELRQYYEAIRENWKNRLTGNSMEDTSDEVYMEMMADLTDVAKEYWESMEKGGNERSRLWSDIDFTYHYQNTTKNVTGDLGTGFSRIEQMATAYSAKGSGLYKNEELKKDITGALEWVYDTIYNDKMSAQKDTYGNWWHWFIGMPQSLCNTVILMYEDLDKDLIEREARTLENFNWDPAERYVVCGGSIVENTAGNLVDTSLVAALRSAIGETAKPLNMARQSLDQTIGFVSSGNGYYEDGSYIDHGNLAYTGGYGSTLLGGMEKLLFLTNNSPWEIDSDKLSSIFQWIWNGIRPLYADGAVMDMTTGRGIARPSTNDHTVGRGLLKPISHLVHSAPEEDREALRSFARTEIEAGLKYNDKYFIGMTVADMTSMRSLLTDGSLGEDQEVYHKNFGVMDKSVYHGENFDLGISMYSKRTGSFEYGNNENRRGWHMSDGALYLYNGDQSQYADAYWPTVDPHRLAGITTDHTEGFIPNSNSWNPHVSTKDWVGGSSVLSQYGTVGMDFEGETKSGGISSLKAKKSWFTFPNAVVALGAGINSSEGKATETIVDNRKVRDDAPNSIWVNGKEIDLMAGQQASMDMSWALLEGNNGEEQNIGYYFPGETKITVLKENRTGNWRDINTAVGAGSANDKEIHRSYVSFAVDHGTNPQNETYSYVLLPGRNLQDMEEFAENPKIRILANTPKVQAVESTEHGVTGYNFWTAYDGEELEVSAETPASVTIAREGETITAGISNPTQNGRDTAVILNSCYEAVEADDGVTVTNENGKTVIIIEGTKDFGKTYRVVLESIKEKLTNWHNKILNGTWSEKADIQEILTKVQALNGTQLGPEEEEIINEIIKTAQEKLALIDSVEEVMLPIGNVNEVTFTINNKTVTFEIKQEGIYGFALKKAAEPKPEPEPNPDPEPDPKPDPEPNPDPSPNQNPRPATALDSSDQDSKEGIWIQNVNGWWFQYSNGTWPSSQWKWINGCWYHFNESGYMETGWILDKELWYYLKPDGSMASNEWISYNNQWYYLFPEGTMAVNTSVRWNGVLYRLGADGAMIVL